MTASTPTLAPALPTTLRPRPARPTQAPRTTGLRAAWDRYRADRASLRQEREIRQAAAGAPTRAMAGEISLLLARR